MAYIHHNKKTDEYKLFGSLTVMSTRCKLDYGKLQYAFKGDKTEYEHGDIKIVRIDLVRSNKHK